MTEKLRDRKRVAALQHAVNKRHYEQASLGDRAADKITTHVGSWHSIGIFTVFLAAWIGLNTLGVILKWDQYPFILLNLGISITTTYITLFVLLSTNRTSERDRLTLEHAAAESELDVQKTEELLAEVRKNTDLMLKVIEQVKAVNK